MMDWRRKIARRIVDIVTRALAMVIFGWLLLLILGCSVLRDDVAFVVTFILIFSYLCLCSWLENRTLWDYCSEIHKLVVGAGIWRGRAVYFFGGSLLMILPQLNPRLFYASAIMFILLTLMLVKVTREDRASRR